MKKVLLIAAAATMVFASCEKKEECKTCSAKVEYYYDGELEDDLSVTSDLGILCGNQLKQVDGQDMETEVTSGDMVIKTVTTYTCK